MGLHRRYGNGKLKCRTGKLRNSITPVLINIVNNRKRGWGVQHKYLVGRTNYRLFYDTLPCSKEAQFWHSEGVITAMFVSKFFTTRKSILHILNSVAEYCKNAGIRIVVIQVTALIANGFTPDYVHVVLQSLFTQRGIRVNVLN